MKKRKWQLGSVDNNNILYSFLKKKGEKDYEKRK